MSQALPAFETVAAFATPILIADLPDGPQLNAALIPVLAKREAEQRGVRDVEDGAGGDEDLDERVAAKMMVIARSSVSSTFGFE